MPEQLTKHPEVTLQVLRSSGAKCAEGAMQEILTKCPTDRFCKLPGGEICVFGLPDAPRMTQITATEWRSLVPTGRTEALQPQVIFSGEVLFSGSVGILAGAVIGITISRLNSHRRH